MGKFNQKTSYHKNQCNEYLLESQQDQKGDIADVPEVPRQNLFQGLNIELGLPIPNLKDFDTKSSLSVKSLGYQLTKKEKRFARQNYLLKKLSANASAKQAVAEMKKRRETPVVGDMKPLEDALPTLQMLMKEVNHGTNNGEEKPVKPRSSLLFKARQKAMIKDVAIFQSIAKSSFFKSNLPETILAHLSEKREKGEML